MSDKPTQFSDFIRDYRGGALDDQLTAAFADVATNVKLLEKPGSVTLKFKLSEKGGAVVVEHQLVHVAPQPKTSGQIFFVTESGGLTRRDPSQPQLPTMEDKDTNR